MCSNKYDKNNFDNLYSHLTNYSINKNNFTHEVHSVKSRSFFEDYLLNNKNIKFSEILLPKIEKIIK